MEKHTTFRAGGPAELFVSVQTEEQLIAVLRSAKEWQAPTRILGRGSNLLVSDEGVKGLVLHLEGGKNPFRLNGDQIVAWAGASLSSLCMFALEQKLSGLEFAYGIPGSVGGAVYMNAGAYGGEIGSVCESVEIMDRNGNLRRIPAREMEFSYRHSALEESGEIVISAVFALTKAEPEAVRARMKELIGKRTASQPLDLPSAGSAFKRPVGGYAAALIDQAGMKGYRVGCAAISEKHSGFAVNLGDATAADVRGLLKQVSDIVFEKTGIRLEPEVRIW